MQLEVETEGPLSWVLPVLLNYGLKNESEQAEHVRCWSGSVCTKVPRIHLEGFTEAVFLQRNV